MTAPSSRGSYSIKLPVFEGPLDLLLHLIREHKIDIYDIPIARITEQYLAYLALMESMDLEIAGEFVVMAATLMEIKSRMLLPQPEAEAGAEDEGADPREELVQRLLEYERYKAAAGEFRALEEISLRIFTREAEPEEPLEVPLADLTPGDLVRALERMLASVSEGEGEITTLQREKVNLRLRMREVWGALQGWDGPMPFRTLFEIFSEGPPSRLEIVVTFLAILELLRGGRIQVRQDRALDEIYLERRAETQGEE
jgi:segregation and condensation protein A